VHGPGCIGGETEHGDRDHYIEAGIGKGIVFDAVLHKRALDARAPGSRSGCSPHRWIRTETCRYHAARGRSANQRTIAAANIEDTGIAELSHQLEDEVRLDRLGDQSEQSRSPSLLGFRTDLTGNDCPAHASGRCSR